MFTTLDISRSALEAQRARMDAIAFNMANVNTPLDALGQANPPKRRFAVFLAGQRQNRNLPGVHATIKQDASVRKAYEPNHPYADRQGYVKYPNIDMATEYINALEASRAYEANVTVMEVSKAMVNSSLRLIA